MPEVPVHADFLNDVRGQLADRLRLSGVPLPAPLSVDAVSFRYWDYKWRLVPASPRTVVQSRELAQRVLAPDHRAGLDAIIEDTTSGRPLSPYFSRQWKNLEVHDLLYNDWHVRHMHLGGRTIEPDGFVKRTGPVLFAYVTSDKLYMIDIMEHGKNHRTTFAKGRIIEIIQDNWPEVIEHGRVPGVSHITPRGDESRRILARNMKGFNATLGFETAEGAVFFMIGGGYMSDGSSMLARRMSDSLLTDAYRLQEWVNSSSVQVHSDIERTTGVSLEELHFQLELKPLARGVELGIREVQSKHVVFQGRTLGFPRKP